MEGLLQPRESLSLRPIVFFVVSYKPLQLAGQKRADANSPLRSETARPLQKPFVDSESDVLFHDCRTYLQDTRKIRATNPTAAAGLEARPLPYTIVRSAGTSFPPPAD